MAIRILSLRQIHLSRITWLMERLRPTGAVSELSATLQLCSSTQVYPTLCSNYVQILLLRRSSAHNMLHATAAACYCLQNLNWAKRIIYVQISFTLKSVKSSNSSGRTLLLTTRCYCFMMPAHAMLSWRLLSSANRFLFVQKNVQIYKNLSPSS